MRWWPAILAACVAGAVALGAARLSGGEPGRSTKRAPALDVRGMASLRTVSPAFRVRTPRPLRANSHEAVWAALKHGVIARRAPRADAAVAARLGPMTPEGTTNIVLVLQQRTVAGGAIWDDVSLAVLPNGSAGWVPRADLNGYIFVNTHLYIDLRRRRLTLARSGRVIFTAPVGVGARGTPTPTGEFYIRDRLTRYASPFYGPVAFGTSARSPVLTDWPAGGYIGIHGTNQPALIPGAVSHGCIRLRNSDIRRLAQLMAVGTPVTITRNGGGT
jgi:hypothetical protein